MVVSKYGKIGIGQFFPDKGLDDTAQVWGLPSEIYASRCSGEVLVILGNVPQSAFWGKIWEEREKPALLSNKDVTMIIEVKPEKPNIPVRLVLPNGLEKAKETHGAILSDFTLPPNLIKPDDIIVLQCSTDESIAEHDYNIGRNSVIIPVKVEAGKVFVDESEIQPQPKHEEEESDILLESLKPQKHKSTLKRASSETMISNRENVCTPIKLVKSATQPQLPVKNPAL